MICVLASIAALSSTTPAAAIRTQDALVTLCAVGLTTTWVAARPEPQAVVWTARRRVGDGRPVDWRGQAFAAAGPPPFTPQAVAWTVRRRVGDGLPVGWRDQAFAAAGPPPFTPPPDVSVWAVRRQVSDGRPLVARQTAFAVSLAWTTPGRATSTATIVRPAGPEAGGYGKKATKQHGRRAGKRGRKARNRGERHRVAAGDGIVVDAEVNDRRHAPAPWRLSSSAQPALPPSSAQPSLPPPQSSTQPPLAPPQSSTQPPLPPPQSSPPWLSALVASLSVSRVAGDRVRPDWLLRIVAAVASRFLVMAVIVAAVVVWNSCRKTRSPELQSTWSSQTMPLKDFTASENEPSLPVNNRISIPYDRL